MKPVSWKYTYMEWPDWATQPQLYRYSHSQETPYYVRDFDSIRVWWFQ